MADQEFFDMLAAGNAPEIGASAGCPGCLQAQQEMAELRRQWMEMDRIKMKIINTDQLIGRYKRLLARHQEQTRSLEEGSRLVAQLHRDCSRHEAELASQLAELTRLREEVQTKSAQLKTMSERLVELEDHKQGAESAMVQYKVALTDLEHRSEAALQAAKDKVIAVEEKRRQTVVRALEKKHREEQRRLLQHAVMFAERAQKNGPVRGNTEA
ncbi:uncharacterized protein LOC119094825 [Pollicipes pollicipes]|uniref:uncharacterized protein LOC119094825 n=1 Tax=Pollicipes pollicipes TaxID=41117 RepID=UPI001884D7F1|nr:uncharacterized protein LOC119094825 [Pollicipes pollicipes]